MPHPSLRSLVLAAALATACSSSTAPLPREGAPDELRLTYGGFGFGSHDVTLRNDTLVVVRRNDFRPESTTTATVVPDAAAWQRFWTAADAAGVARWPRRCPNTNVVDGGGFSLRIVAGTRTWESEGSNSYPQANGRCSGEPEHSRDFQAFTAAVSQLIGRPFP